MSKRVIGVIGGMGPMATVDTFSKLVTSTSANCDQEHRHVIIDNNTSIPDRSAHIMGRGNSPIQEMKKSIDRLVQAGAKVLGMPCNTAHYYYETLNKYIKSSYEDVHFINMIGETCGYCIDKGYKSILILGTQGTYESDIYNRNCVQDDIQIIYPQNIIRDEVMEMIYEYKNGETILEERKLNLINIILVYSVDAIILGCTELPLIFSGIEIGVPLIDPGQILVDELLKYK